MQEVNVETISASGGALPPLSCACSFVPVAAGIAGKDSSCWHRMRLSAVLIDLSGTLHVGSSEVPGAVQALQRLRQSQLKV